MSLTPLYTSKEGSIAAIRTSASPSRTSTSQSLSDTDSVVIPSSVSTAPVGTLAPPPPNGNGIKKRERKNKTNEAFQQIREKILAQPSEHSITFSDSDAFQVFGSGNMSKESSGALFQRSSLSDQVSANSIAIAQDGPPLRANIQKARSRRSSTGRCIEILVGSPGSSVYTAAFDHTPEERIPAPLNGTILERELSGLVISDSTSFAGAKIGNNGQVPQDLDSLEPRISVLGSMSIFGEGPDLLMKLRPFLQFKVYEAGTELQKQGDLMQTIYWILDGNCDVSQNVSFIQVLIGDDWIFKQVYQDALPNGPNEKLVYKNIDSQNLDPGSWFPYLSGIEPTQQLTKLDLLTSHSNHTCDLTVTAETRVMVAQISLQSFVEIASVPMLYNLHQQTSIYRFKHPFLREEFLAQSETEEKRSKFPMTNSISISFCDNSQ